MSAMQNPSSGATLPLLTAISSMATKALLQQLLVDYAQQGGAQVKLESVGGVDAAKRVRAGECFDLVFLASDALDGLLAGGHLQAGSKCDLARSGVAIAVQAGAPQPDISSAEAVRDSVLAARNISYSTGPSGVALARLFAQWGIEQALLGRIVTAPPGVPVGSLVARGEVELGFQQRSELLNLQGISLLGDLPPSIQITTTFSGAVGQGCVHPQAARALLHYLTSPAAAATIRAQGMEPAAA